MERRNRCHNKHCKKCGNDFEAPFGWLAENVICPHCKARVTPEQAGVGRLGEMASRVSTTFTGKGCALCNGTGYRGRLGVFEFVSQELLRQAAAASNPETVKRAAIEKHAMVPMLDQALAKVEAGITSVDEVVRAVFTE